MKSIKIRLGFITLLVFMSMGLARSNAEELNANCLYAGEEYSPGACRGGQRCQSDGTWRDDRNCPATEIQ